MSLKTRSRPARYSALLAIPLLVGVLAACSSGGGAANEKTPAAAESFEDWQVGFASCMRAEGVDMPDPGKDGSTGAIKLGGEDGEAFQAASETCMQKVGEPPAPPGGKKTEKEFADEQLKMAKCFRDNGIDVPDPKPNEGFTIPEASEDIMKKCFGNVPGGGGAVSVQPAG